MANLDAVSVDGEALFRRDMGPLHLARRFFGHDDRAYERFADYTDYALEVQGDVATVVEPMRWTTVEAPPPDSWPHVRESCDRHHGLLVSDDIRPASDARGRCSPANSPASSRDVLVIGKGLSGGVMPMAAMIASAGRGDSIDRCSAADL